MTPRRRWGRAALLLGLLATPVAAETPWPELPPPVALTPATIAVPPSAAVRAYVLSLAERPLTAPVAVPLLCLTNREGGIDDCVADSPAVPPRLNFPAFMALARNGDLVTLDHGPAGLARIQARTMLLRGEGPARLIRLTITLDPADVRPVATRPPVPRAEVQKDASPHDRRLGALYPGAALRNGSGAAVTVTCRVEEDRSLACRDGRVAPATVEPALAEAFVAASLQANALWRVRPTLAGGGNAVGSEFMTTNRWMLP